MQNRSSPLVQDDNLMKENMRSKMKSGHVDQGEEEVVPVGDEDEGEDLVLPGFRFHPTDEELVTFYLRRKVAGKRLSIEIIKDFDIYKHDPWDLPKASTISMDKEWYFFCLRGRKYRNSIRPNRVTGSGFWKATGIDRPIYSGGGGGRAGDCIGLKKSLVFYRGSAGKGTKTEWMMHEFRLPPRPESAGSSPSSQEAEVWTICRIFRRSITTYKKQPQATAAAAAQPDSSSNTGSLESDTGDEYMNSLTPPPQAPLNNNNVSDVYHQFQGQWNSSGVAQPVPLVPQQHSPAAMASAFHHGAVHSSSPAAPDDLYHKDGCSWDDIGRMVMELTDPSVFYYDDCTFA